MAVRFRSGIAPPQNWTDYLGAAFSIVSHIPTGKGVYTIDRILEHPAYRRAVIFLIGAFGYGTIEIAWRGYTHVSMLLLGGLCLLLLMWIAKRPIPLMLKCALGSAAITALEFAFGLIVNRWLGLAVWDYSANRFNVLGQICLKYSGLWFLLCIAIFGVHALADALIRSYALRLYSGTIPLIPRRAVRGCADGPDNRQAASAKVEVLAPLIRALTRRGSA